MTAAEKYGDAASMKMRNTNEQGWKMQVSLRKFLQFEPNLSLLVIGELLCLTFPALFVGLHAFPYASKVHTAQQV